MTKLKLSIQVVHQSKLLVLKHHVCLYVVIELKLNIQMVYQNKVMVSNITTKCECNSLVPIH
jgi:hypothetical protein